MRGGLLGVAALALLTGCGDAVWVPAVGLPWWDEETQVPAESIEGDCTVVFTEVVVGLPEASIDVDGEPAFAPPNIAVDLALGVTTLGEVRVLSSAEFGAVALSVGPVGEAVGSAADGTATDSQREFTGGGTLGMTVVCGDDSAQWQVPLPEAALTCAIPDTLEVVAQSSFGTLAIFDPLVVLGGEPLDGAALLADAPVAMGNGWTNSEGTACVAE